MHKRLKQREIQQREKRDTQETNAWLKAQGLSADKFAELDLDLLHAQRIAHNCLKYHGRLLSAADTRVLNDFLQALHNTKKRRRITRTQAFKIMNIGNKLNRQLFKQHRHATRRN
jgi:hypothetical protein